MKRVSHRLVAARYFTLALPVLMFVTALVFVFNPA